MNAVRLTRYLREDMVRVGATARMSGRPISAEIYSLSLSERGRTTSGGAQKDETVAAVGVFASDAARFVEWANEITGYKSSYRLPAGEEIEEPAVQRRLVGLPWIGTSIRNGAPSLWVPTGAAHPHNVSSEVLRRHVVDDFAHLTPALIQLASLQVLYSGRDLSQIVARNSMGGRDFIGEVGVRANSLARGFRSNSDIERMLERDLLRFLDSGVDFMDGLIKTITERGFDVAALGGLLRLSIGIAADFSHPFVTLLGININPRLKYAAAHGYEASSRDKLSEIIADFSSNSSITMEDRLIADTAFLARIISRNEDPFLREISDPEREDIFSMLMAVRLLRRKTDLKLGKISSLLTVSAPLFELKGSLVDFVGRALSSTLYDTFRQDTKDAEQRTRVFASMFLRNTGAAEYDRVVDLDSLGDSLRQARLELRTILFEAGLSRMSWAAPVADRLDAFLVSHVSGRTPLLAEDACAARIVALILAAEAAWHAGNEAGNLYREVAAGVTLLERRAAGRVPAEETIYLAED